MRILCFTESSGLCHADSPYFGGCEQAAADMCDLAREAAARGFATTLCTPNTRDGEGIRGVEHRLLANVSCGELTVDLAVSNAPGGAKRLGVLLGKESPLCLLHEAGMDTSPRNDVVRVARSFRVAAEWSERGQLPSSICVIAPLVARDFLAPPGERPLAPGDTKRIVFPVVSRKGMQNAIEAIRRLRQYRSDLRTVLAMFFSRLPEAEADPEALAIARGLEDVQVVETLSRPQWLELLRIAAVIACLDDSIAAKTNIPLEASAYGRAVVAPDTSAYRQLLGPWSLSIPSTISLFDLDQVVERALTTVAQLEAGSRRLAEGLNNEISKRIAQNHPARFLDALLAATDGLRAAQQGSAESRDWSALSTVPVGSSHVVADQPEGFGSAAGPEAARLPSEISRLVVNHNKLVLVGRYSFLGGYGSIIQNYVSALHELDVDHVVYDSLQQQIVGGAKGDFWSFDSASQTISSADNIVVVLCEVPTDFDKLAVSGRARLIGCTLFETHTLPAKWLPFLHLVDELWVPTKFNLETFRFAGVPAEKLRMVPYCLDCSYHSASVEPLPLEGVKTFRFLSVLSNFNRKDVGLLLRAYYEEFSSAEDVSLILKVLSESQAIGDQIARMVGPSKTAAPEDLPHTLLLQERMSRDVLRRLYAACDVYATTERAKGWDYPAMEAMAQGKPVVSIDWSGSTEFLNEGNSFLVSPRANLVTADPMVVSDLDIYIGQRYVDVSELEVRRALRKAFEDSEARSVRGDRAKNDVQDYSLNAVGAKIREIVGSYGPAAFRGTDDPEVRIRPFTHLQPVRR